jgi:hypothetical protein
VRLVFFINIKNSTTIGIIGLKINVGDTNVLNKFLNAKLNISNTGNIAIKINNNLSFIFFNFLLLIFVIIILSYKSPPHLAFVKLFSRWHANKSVTHRAAIFIIYLNILLK